MTPFLEKTKDNLLILLKSIIFVVIIANYLSSNYYDTKQLNCTYTTSAATSNPNYNAGQKKL